MILAVYKCIEAVQAFILVKWPLIELGSTDVCKVAKSLLNCVNDAVNWDADINKLAVALFKDAVTLCNVVNLVFTDAVQAFISVICPNVLALNVFKLAVALLNDAVTPWMVVNLLSILAVYVCNVVNLFSKEPVFKLISVICPNTLALNKLTDAVPAANWSILVVCNEFKVSLDCVYEFNDVNIDTIWFEPETTPVGNNEITCELPLTTPVGNSGIIWEEPDTIPLPVVS